jgi:competence protein ComEA
MSEDLSALPPLPSPDSWRDRVAAYAETLDLTPGRLVMGVVVGAVILVAGWRLMATSAEPPEARLPMVTTTSLAGAGPTATTTTTALTAVVVHVAGAVKAPGVQRLDAGARVVDAIDAAGGAASDADLSRVNLAAVLEDGQQVFVPKVGEVGGGAPGGTPVEGEPADGAAAGPVHLNTATAAELETLPGIGPSLAEAIVDFRASNGTFTSVDQLLDVRGIGQSKLEALRDQVVL